MIKIVLFSALFLATGNPTHGPAPKIVEQHTIYNFDCDDPLGVGCRVQSLTLMSKNLKPVLTKVNCGSEFDESDVVVYPRTKQTVTIETNLPLGPEGCTIGKWYQLEEKKP